MNAHRYLHLVLALLALLLTACPVDRYTVRPQTSMSDKQVVQALADAAGQEKQAGRFDNAAGLYERALRIEPGNAVLWTELADLRYDQEQFRQVLALAAKSNTLAGDKQALKIRNWRLMGDARKELGEDQAAKVAYERAKALENIETRRWF
ncbi:MAG: tetratricopeptide repeat protein [Gammaproteobacteria bacterium]|nr:tetratricopeptide repeat protein [Gammaproteobacteria bacterium]